MSLLRLLKLFFVTSFFTVLSMIELDVLEMFVVRIIADSLLMSDASGTIETNMLSSSLLFLVFEFVLGLDLEAILDFVSLWFVDF